MYDSSSFISSKKKKGEKERSHTIPSKNFYIYSSFLGSSFLLLQLGLVCLVSSPRPSLVINVPLACEKKTQTTLPRSGQTLSQVLHLTPIRDSAGPRLKGGFPISTKLHQVHIPQSRIRLTKYNYFTLSFLWEM